MKGISFLASGGILAVSRVVGMLCNFFLFVVIARNSVEGIGEFRTVLTFFLVLELIPLLGMQKWLAKTVAANRERQSLYFSLSIYVSLFAAVLLMAAFGFFSFQGVYSEGISKGLLIVSFVAVPSAVYLVSNTMLLAIGRVHEAGVISCLESLARSLVGLYLVYLGKPIESIVICYVVVRWFVAIFSLCWLLIRYGFNFVLVFFDNVKNYLKEVPIFLVIMLSFLGFRYLVILLLPYIQSVEAAGSFSIAYQLFDFAALVPTMLIIGLNHKMCLAASNEGDCRDLEKIIAGSISIIGVYAFFLPVLFFFVSETLVSFVFGRHYQLSVPALCVMICAIPLLMFDQILSQAMIAINQQRLDFIAMLAGFLVMVLLSFPMIGKFSYFGAALTFFISLFFLTLSRIILLRRFFNMLYIFRHAVPHCMSMVLCLVVVFLIQRFSFLVFDHSDLILSAIFFLTLKSLLCFLCFIAFLYLFGGFSSDRRLVMKFAVRS